MLDDFRQRLDELLRRAGAAEPRAGVEALAEAAVEARAAVHALSAARDATHRALEAERGHLVDAERRGALAEAVPDPETVRVAREFAARHRERVELLARKLVVQDEEVALATRESEELTARLRELRRGLGTTPLDEARPDDDGLTDRTRSREHAALEAELDRRRREEAVEAQLAELKRRAGRQ